MKKKKSESGVEFQEKDLEVNTIFFGDRKIIFESLCKKFEEENGVEKFLVLKIEKMNLGVDEVRLVKSFVSKTSDKEKIVILSSFYWNESAQNAMLKTLEETPPNTKMFLIGLSKNFFLPTVLSRIQKVSLQNMDKYSELAKEILSLENHKRLGNKKVVKLLAQKVEEINFSNDEISSKKDREEHILFLQSLVNVLLESKSVFNGQMLTQINIITQHVYDPGGSPHLLVEWLLLSAQKIDMV